MTGSVGFWTVVHFVSTYLSSHFQYDFQKLVNSVQHSALPAIAALSSECPNKDSAREVLLLNVSSPEARESETRQSQLD